MLHLFERYDSKRNRGRGENGRRHAAKGLVRNRPMGAVVGTGASGCEAPPLLAELADTC